MSLKSALLMAAEIEVKNGILTISEIGSELNLYTLYGCFLCDISLSHSYLGKGSILDFKNNKWICDFTNSAAFIEMNTQTLIKYLN